MTAVIALCTLAGSAPSGTGGAVRSGAAPSVVPASMAAPDRCLSARRAVPFYRAHTWERQSARGGALADRTPVVRGKSCQWARYAARTWSARATAARLSLERWLQYHYAWREWLPRNWRALGACETGYGREPGNWYHDSGTHVSAFGITRHNYAVNAARIGLLSWDETRRRLGRYPTPREQYLNALSHLATYGDGWTCPGP